MRWSDQCSSALLRNLGTEVRIIGSDNWVVQNLENALEVWNGKLSEIWQLITQSPQDFKGWSHLDRDRGHPRRAPGHRLRPAGTVLRGGCMGDLRQLCGGQKPEHALKLFVRFALAKALITYGMELMLSLLDIIQMRGVPRS